MTLHKNLVRMQSKDKVSGINYVKNGTNLCRLPNGLGCIGCCGFDFAKNLSNKTPFINALKENTQEYQELNDKETFKNKYDPCDLQDCGLCRILILKKDENIDTEILKKRKHLEITCPLHPAENNGIELRKGQCDLAFMCETQKMFHKEWGEWTKNKFVEFIYQKDLDWFEYSKKMHNNSLVKEFFETNLGINFQE